MLPEQIKLNFNSLHKSIFAYLQVRAKITKLM